MHNKLQEKRGDKSDLAIGFGNTASMAQIQIGMLKSAEYSLSRQIDICEQSKLDKSQQPGIYYELGRVYCYTGKWNEAEKLFEVAEEIKKDNSQAKGIIWAYRALRQLLMARIDSNNSYHILYRSKNLNINLAIESVIHALKFAEEATSSSSSPVYKSPR
jgi:tetratricopeptide (TPR) repeat protein